MNIDIDVNTDTNANMQTSISVWMYTYESGFTLKTTLDLGILGLFPASQMVWNVFPYRRRFACRFGAVLEAQVKNGFNENTMTSFFLSGEVVFMF